MEAKSSVPKTKGARQQATAKEALARANKLIVELPQIAQRIEGFGHALGGVLAPLALISETLIENSDRTLEIVNEEGKRIEYSDMALAGGEALELFISKLYTLHVQIDYLHSDLDRKLREFRKPEVPPTA